MAITAFTGPIIAFGAGNTSDYNSQLGPSQFVVGTSLLDARSGYQPGNAVTTPCYGWYASGDVPVINYAPSALAANNIAASQAATAGTPLTLVSASGAGITVGATVVNILGGISSTSALAIDGAMGFLPFGTDGTIQCYDPTKMISRAVRVVSTGNDSGGAFLIVGYDIYGQRMTQLLTGANAGTATTTKCFKYIQSITPQAGVSGSNVTVGTTDVYGLPLRADSWFQLGVVWAGSWVTASTGFVPAVQTNPATPTTGDVRGSYATQSASNGTNVLQITITPNPNALATGSLTGLSGVAVATTGVTQA